MSLEGDGMGSFYTNMHVKTTDRDQVARAWMNYWEGREDTSWCFIAPPYNGWVALFDWRCDQQDTDILVDLASHLSRAAECAALVFQVHDSALAEYWLFNLGAEVDHYTSNTEYFAAYAQLPTAAPDTEGIFVGFGPDTDAGYAEQEDLSDGGNVDLLRSLTNDLASEVQFEAILRTPAYIADDILTALASAIGLNDSWAAVGYHYLVTEGDTIPGLGDFHHLPPGAPANPARFAEHGG